MAGKSTKFKSVSNHVEDLASGQTVGPGETFNLTAEDQQDPHNQRLIDEEIIVEAEGDKETKEKEGGKA
jgi:hypothetical protein